MLPLPKARRYADHLLAWLAPHCERLQLAGSIRRERPHVNDVDIVCIPKSTEQKDLLGCVTGRTNHCLEFLRQYVHAAHAPESLRQYVRAANPGQAKPRFICGHEREGKQVIIDLPKCQLDLWFADEETFGTRLLCRTGSKEHNIWLCQRAQLRGLHWDPYNGLTNVDLAEPIEAPTEEAIYAALGLPYIAAQNRERDWLAKHIEFGL